MPIGCVAVSDPAQLLAPNDRDAIWAIQRDLDFPQTVYGVPQGTGPDVLMRRQSAWFAAHRNDREVGGSDSQR
ncbi:MAG TPA: hypothetical protein VGR11_12530 [Solirubrobacteraceae bacterium]|nr:hypothetical protein [Solirubrobacteraceae bacterium]